MPSFFAKAPYQGCISKISLVLAFTPPSFMEVWRYFNRSDSVEPNTEALSVLSAGNRLSLWQVSASLVADIWWAWGSCCSKLRSRGYIDQPISTALVTPPLLWVFFSSRDLWQFFYFMGVWVELLKPNSVWKPNWDALTVPIVGGCGGGLDVWKSTEGKKEGRRERGGRPVK